MSTSSDFRFFPRPEAHAASWDCLLPPVQDAVYDLLFRLGGATERMKPREGRGDCESQWVSNCFLVYGDRGTGKTTVLLSAQRAVRDWPGFFGGVVPAETKKERASRDAKGLAGAVWLDVLDLEPLPAEANLLTTLLTRVRDALGEDGEDGEKRGEARPTSLFEESEHSARQQLQRLINDATLMWENISEPDTRSRASREVQAADIYASFRKRFKEALSTLSAELGRWFARDAWRPIILPIDNIDRSTEHLYAIIKLAQMVSCPHLWLVMAGDREDIDTFLERAFWKELIRVGTGAGASGKGGPYEEDEAFVMSRRQAAAASQKLLPPSHRIEVQRVRAEDTLRFRLVGACDPVDAKGPGAETIYELLAKVKIPAESGAPSLNFIDLLDSRKLLPKVSCPKCPDNIVDTLTLAARHGLQLPARGVLDLWQLAHAVVTETDHDPKGKDFRAEKIARTMLRNVIPPSRLTNDLGRLLQDQVIRRHAGGGTMLDFSDAQVKVWRLRRPVVDIRSRASVAQATDGQQLCSVVSKLTLSEIEDVTVEMARKSSASSSGSVGGGTAQGVELPQLVAAWLVILHDILIWAQDSSVVSRGEIPTAAVVETSHAAATSGRPTTSLPEERWPAPVWNTFLAHDLFRLKWGIFRRGWEEKGGLARTGEGVEGASDPPADRTLTSNSLLLDLVCGWVDCALWTFRALFPADTAPGNDGATRSPPDDGGADGESKETTVTAEERFKQVLIDAAEAYGWIQARRAIPSDSEGVTVLDHHYTFMRDWLENDLPLLFSYRYVPMAPCAGENTDVPITAVLRDLIVPRKGRAGKVARERAEAMQSLVEGWIANWPFLQAKLDADLNKLFDLRPESAAPAAGSEPRASPTLKAPEKLGPFGALHRLFQDLPDPQG